MLVTCITAKYSGTQVHKSKTGLALSWVCSNWVAVGMKKIDEVAEKSPQQQLR
jgi:hypothetical protein